MLPADAFMKVNNRTYRNWDEQDERVGFIEQEDDVMLGEIDEEEAE